MDGKGFLPAAWRGIKLVFLYAVLIAVWGLVGYVYLPPIRR
jgi:hypothetical protein